MPIKKRESIKEGENRSAGGVALDITIKQIVFFVFVKMQLEN